MAPMAGPRADQDTVEQQLKETIQSLYQILVQVSAYDTSGSSRPSSQVLAQEVRALEASLQAVHLTASTPTPEASMTKVPPDLIQYVENGRNPDVYTREFVEFVRRNNQLMKGKLAAFASFRDVLAGEIEKAMPELKDDAARVVAATSAAAAAAATSAASATTASGGQTAAGNSGAAPAPASS